MYAADAAQCFQDLQFRCVRTSLDGVFDNVSDAAAGCMPTQLMASPDSNRPAALSTYHSPTETLQAQELICADMAVLVSTQHHMSWCTQEHHGHHSSALTVDFVMITDLKPSILPMLIRK